MLCNHRAGLSEKRGVRQQWAGFEAATQVNHRQGNLRGYGPRPRSVCKAGRYEAPGEVEVTSHEAVMLEAGNPLEIVEFDVEGPKRGEMRVEIIRSVVIF